MFLSALFNMWPKKIKAMTLRCGRGAGAHGRESSLNRGKLPDASAVVSFTINIIYPEVLKNANLKKKIGTSQGQVILHPGLLQSCSFPSFPSLATVPLFA